jgi:hypothetical protein
LTVREAIDLALAHDQCPPPAPAPTAAGRA